MKAKFLSVLLLVSIFVGVACAPVRGERGGLAADTSIVAQQGAITHEFMVGEWATRNVEFGRDVEILWTLWADGRLAYRFIVDGVVSEGARGTWKLDGQVVGTIVIEHWLRPNGETGVGRGLIEKIDENTLRLSIVDNGEPSYQGMVRVYRRRGAPQISSAEPNDAISTHRLPDLLEDRG